MTYIELGEQAIRDDGHYVALPINWLILFTSAEIEILCLIRHYSRYQRYISDSFIRITTGRGNKAITKAKKSLMKMGVIKVDYRQYDKRGSQYEINYELLCSIGEMLNSEGCAYRRLELVDEFRGTGNELHSQLIKEYNNSTFNFL